MERWSGGSQLPETFTAAPKSQLDDAGWNPNIIWGGPLGFLADWYRDDDFSPSSIELQRLTPQGVPIPTKVEPEVAYGLGFSSRCLVALADDNAIVGWTEDFYGGKEKYQRYNRSLQKNAAFGRDIACVQLFADSARRLIAWDGSKVQMQTQSGSPIAGPMSLRSGVMAAGAATDLVVIYPREFAPGQWALFGQRYAGPAGAP